MNRSLLALLPLALLTFACPNQEDTPDSGTSVDTGIPKDTGVDTGTPPPDSGTPGTDAGDDAGAIDGQVEDTGTDEDAGMMDVGTSTSGEVILRVTLDGMPPPGIIPFPILFHDANGALILETLLDVNGEARAEVPLGGMVSIVTPTGGGKEPEGLQIDTMAGLEPPETLTIDLLMNEVPTSTVVNDVTVTLPGLFPTAESHSLEFGCTEFEFPDNMVTANFPIIPDCLIGSTGLTSLGLLAEARDAQFEMIAYAELLNVPLGVGVNATIPGPWRTDFANRTVSVTNAPAEFLSVGVYDNLVQDGRAYVPTFTPETELIAGAADLGFDTPMFGEAADVSLYLYGNAGASARYLTRTLPDASISLDLANALLPIPTNLTVNNSTNVARPIFTWMLGQPTMADMVLLDAFTSDSLRWSVALPPGTSITMPELPASLIDYIPTALTDVSFSLFLFDTSTEPNLRALRDRADLDTPTGIIERHVIFRDQPVGATTRYTIAE